MRRKPPSRHSGPKVGQGPRISLVMIAKDEENMLPRALASAQPWVDDIVLVDTGSTDRTVDIARQFGAKVYHHPWENDFSKHRNQAVSYATGQWLLQLDADEELDQQTAPLLRGLVANPAVNGYQVEMYNVFGEGMQTPFFWPRLFRNMPGVCYYRRVHNQVRIPGPLAVSRVRMFHYGYNLDPASMAAKHQRRLAMIGQWVNEEPDNWEARYFHAQTLVTQPQTAPAALAEAVTALNLARRAGQSPQVISRVYVPLLQALEELQRDQEAIRIGLEWHKLVPEHPDALLFLGRALERTRQWEGLWQVGEAFWRLHLEMRQRPDKFASYELLSGGLAFNFFTSFARAGIFLNRLPAVAEVFQRNFCSPGAESEAMAAVDSAWQAGLQHLARELARLAGQVRPEWSWPRRWTGQEPAPVPDSRPAWAASPPSAQP